ncbi:hypothetical protein TDB9533_03747 [Thalassocella blandensis]|nr:hypothetical protein TDB9533_03747 [Thalassocella blandensis]
MASKNGIKEWHQRMASKNGIKEKRSRMLTWREYAASVTNFICFFNKKNFLVNLHDQNP